MPSQAQYPSIIGRIRRALLSRRTHLLLGALTVLAVLFAGFDATRTRPSDGTVWRLGGQKLEVLDILPQDTNFTTPLRRGDEIIGIGSVITPTPQQAATQLRRFRPGQTVPYLISRNGYQQIVTVHLGSTRVDLQSYAINVVLALIYLIIGFAVYLRSGNDRPANLFFTLCLLFSLYFTTNLQQVSYFLGALITQNIGAFARFMLPAIFLHFFLVFPAKKMTLTRYPFLSPLIYVLPLLFYIHFVMDQFMGTQGAQITASVWMILGIYYVLGLAALLHGYLSYRDPLMRERVRILTYGTMLAVIPFLVFKIGLEELSYQANWARLGAIPLAAIPISFGYCVARYQILHIDLLVKRNLAYGVMTGSTWLSYFGSAWWLGGLFLTRVQTGNHLFATGAILVIAAALWPLRLALQGIWDRRFYHARDNMTSVIEDISREIPQLIKKDLLLRRVGARLSEALGLPSIAFYLPQGITEEGEFELMALVQEPIPLPRPQNELDPSPPAEIQGVRPRTDYPQHMALPLLSKTLGHEGEPMWIDSSPLEIASHHEAITREQAELNQRLLEQRQLGKQAIQLLIPMISGHRLVGIVALPVRPGLDYEVHELQLLTIVAGQVALQTENSRLYEEEIEKQKIEEELAMARRIQARLLPSEIPTLSGVEIHAVNISSKQVSGDYYDLVLREDGKLAIVIADVSGKGMPASILASNLQAAVRAQCDMCDSPAMILDRINRQIYASTEPEHFATLFLAFFDPDQRRLIYSSGGHNAPVLVKGDGTFRELDKGGLPLGAFDFGTYEEETIALEEGDLLFLYTDGLTETKGPDGDEDFGETRLNNLLLARSRTAVDELINGITDDLIAFSGRREHDDDITMIALRIGAACDPALARAQKQ